MLDYFEPAIRFIVEYIEWLDFVGSELLLYMGCVGLILLS